MASLPILASFPFLFFTLFPSLAFSSNSQPYPSRLDSGFSFSRDASSKFTDDGSIILASPAGSFFLALTSCRLVIVHNDSSTLDVVVWDAKLPNCSQATFQTFLFREDGNLVVLTTTMERTVEGWSTGTANKDVKAMELQETGNLVLLSAGNVPVWQSFDCPSFVLLTGQKLCPGKNLSITDFNSGISYSLVLEHDRLVLYALGIQPEPYWQLLPAAQHARVSYAALDRGVLQLYDEHNNGLTNQPINSTVSTYTLWRAQLGSSTNGLAGAKHGGNLEIYYWSSEKGWHLQSQAVSNICKLPDGCKQYSTCNPETQQCSCPEPLVPSTWGCDLPQSARRGVQENFCSSALSPPDYLGFVRLHNTTYFPLLSGATGYESSFGDCRSYCLQNCSCAAFAYDDGAQVCYPIHANKDASTMGFVRAQGSSPFSSVYVRIGSSASLSSSGSTISLWMLVGFSIAAFYLSEVTY